MVALLSVQKHFETYINFGIPHPKSVPS